jgi:hypothetical protein
MIERMREREREKRTLIGPVEFSTYVLLITLSLLFYPEDGAEGALETLLMISQEYYTAPDARRKSPL